MPASNGRRVNPPDAEVDELTPIMRNKEQDVEGAEGEGLDGEQVGSPDLGAMIGQEGAPSLAR